MREAIRLSDENVKNGGGPFGAVIVKNGEIIATGVNRVTDLSGCDIYTSCEPCPMCLGAIYWAHLDRMYYACNKDDAADAGFDDSFIYKELDLEASERRLKSENMLRSEALKTFEAWKEKGDKVEY